MIYAIGDLHLSFSKYKPMDIFGNNWEKHYKKIKIDWESKVLEDDLVIIPGDISWAMSYLDAKPDLDYISKLQGKKVFVKGNHDYWWKSISQLRADYSELNMYFLQNDSFIYNDIAICGTRGFVCPGSQLFNKEDEKIYIRELNRLRASLDKADPSVSKICVMMHYPPTNETKEPSGFTKLFEEYGVSDVIYGHLHGEHFNYGLQGIYNGINYHLVSADFLDFKLASVLQY